MNIQTLISYVENKEVQKNKIEKLQKIIEIANKHSNGLVNVSVDNHRCKVSIEGMVALIEEEIVMCESILEEITPRIESMKLLAK
jgi:hypothetical protein